ncbi:MAG: protein-export chaperone SecB [Endozoicomonadaceae bacterium]|nr:protein-export chaperone SecB [Endozoicomonadaceae bacterium]MCY4330410.1 protein-export chaperone SecB [Endozoicomonadaceae bacterium]
MENQNNDHQKTVKDQQPQFALQRIYVKDISFESPKSPLLFKQNWKPEIKLDLNTSNNKLDEDDFYEVILSLTVTVKTETETAFVAEVHQAGIFLISNLAETELQHTLGAFCPNILFPYARETIDNLVVRASFPPVMLSPVNFDMLYEHVLQEKKKSKKADAGADDTVISIQ